jgi:glycerate kinase
MPLKVLIVPDKFKGTLTSRAATEAIARGWRKARPGDSLRLLPMSDGGDGFGEVMGGLLQAEIQHVKTIDAAHRPCVVKWWWQPKVKTAVVESAAVIGLAMLPAKRFHPFELDTFGLAAVIRAAARKGAKRCLMGIGGSATNDAGFGLARGLGWEFVNEHGNSIERWTGLDGLRQIRAPKRRRWFDDLLVAVDVQNPLLGRRGATRVYGPQKGLRPGDFEVAERCLRRLAQVVKRDFGRGFVRAPGAGAAGGLGFGLLAFLDAKLEPGFDLFARYAALGGHLRWADLGVTGEGAIDHSTFMGKGVGQIAQCCRKLKIPCIGLAGVVSASRRTAKLFAQTRALTQLTTVQQAKAQPARWLERLAQQVARSAWDTQARHRT